MDAKNFEYLKNKVGRFEQLQIMRENLDALQVRLVNDEPINIKVGEEDFLADDNTIQFGDTDTKKASSCHVKDEYECLLREIKDNLIDAIGMKIVEINEKMEEL